MSQTLRLTLGGPTWDRWEQRVKRALLEIDGVEGVTASSQASLVGIAFDAIKVTLRALKKLAEEFDGAIYLDEGHVVPPPLGIFAGIPFATPTERVPEEQAWTG